MFATLKTRLLAWLIVPLLFLTAAYSVITFYDTQETAEKIFDRMLVTLALSISEHALASGGDLLTDDVLELIRVTTNDNLYYKVIGPDAAFVMGYEDVPEPKGGLQVLDGHVQFYDASYFDQDVRVIAVSSLVDRPEFSGWMTTYVAQTINDRNELIWSTVLNNSVLVLGLASITVVLLAVGVSVGLRPLSKLQDVIENRQSNDLRPIESESSGLGATNEISLLVGAINDLLARLSDHVSLTKRFVENAAHELRTPVAALLPQSTLALRHAESEREQRAVGRIKQSAENIARLTHQLLNLTYAESVRLSNADFPTIDLGLSTDQAISEFQSRTSDLEVKKDLVNVSIKGSTVSIGEVVTNLLDNVLVHSDAKLAQVNVYAKEDMAYLEVLDDGRGVPAEALDKLCERFYRRNQEPNGSGLGLAIVKEIVEVHGGQLTLRLGENTSGLSVSCAFPIEKEA